MATLRKIIDPDMSPESDWAVDPATQPNNNPLPSGYTSGWSQVPLDQLLSSQGFQGPSTYFVQQGPNGPTSQKLTGDAIKWLEDNNLSVGSNVNATNELTTALVNPEGEITASRTNTPATKNALDRWTDYALAAAAAYVMPQIAGEMFAGAGLGAEAGVSDAALGELGINTATGIGVNGVADTSLLSTLGELGINTEMLGTGALDSLGAMEAGAGAGALNSITAPTLEEVLSQAPQLTMQDVITTSGALNPLEIASAASVAPEVFNAAKDSQMYNAANGITSPVTTAVPKAIDLGSLGGITSTGVTGLPSLQDIKNAVATAKTVKDTVGKVKSLISGDSSTGTTGTTGTNGAQGNTNVASTPMYGTTISAVNAGDSSFDVGSMGLNPVGTNQGNGLQSFAQLLKLLGNKA